MTSNDITYSADERQRLLSGCLKLGRLLRGSDEPSDFRKIKATLDRAAASGGLRRDSFGNNPVLMQVDTACLLCERISPDRNMAAAILLAPVCLSGASTPEELRTAWGDDVVRLLSGLLKASSLYERHTTAKDENFRNLLLTFAEDIRVIIMMIVGRLALMRAINHHPDEAQVADVAAEANYLYAALAHRLGLYTIKSELEDLSLKYTNRDTYSYIAKRLNETKVERDRYIADFIEPIRRKLEAEGLNFEIKGRTKSIYSIWNKMRKQQNDIDDIFDLFAIRIVLDVDPEHEKSKCWLVYSIITDMYRPNPSRLKDWLSIPKSNGYESLHTTVYGPDNRWVEVQIRSRRMDVIAEKGLAAHWKYKGIKSENNLDTWMNNVRDILETAESGPLQLMRDFKMDIYDKEVFAFTPKGDLYRLPQGATLLDFAFAIHTKLGTQCTGGKVNGRNRKINYKLHSGDTVEVFTSPQQVPKRDWLNFTVTGKARNKIRAMLKEIESRASELGREMVQRRFKNRKIEIDESVLSRCVKKAGYKTVTDFFTAIANESLDINKVVDIYTSIENERHAEAAKVSASEYVMSPSTDDEGISNGGNDVVIIGNNIKGINYRLAKCCNPIYGDDVFGFVSGEGVVKIHRTDCPNAENIRRKYPYRLIRVAWGGNTGTQFAATLRIVGKDEIGIVTNITSLINKEKDVSLRNISIDSHDGLFHGYVVIGVGSTQALNQLVKKIKTVKGVKDVQRNK